jgi:Domain of unknown function (DUF1707)/Cell wall-active antibiotics response 4TMS YvqF
MLRVSDAEREHVVGVLQKAVGRGLITLDEFSTRTDQALAAKTRGELNSVLIDLPDLRHTALEPRPRPNEQPLLIRTGSGTIKQNGAWHVPAAVSVECGMGTIVLDFTEAVLSHREVTLRATAGAGTITVIVPRGWRVTMVEAVTRFGSVINKATDPVSPDLPELRVHARAGMGTVKLRHPRGRR